MSHTAPKRPNLKTQAARPLLKIAVAVITGIPVLLGLIVGILTLLPRISVTASDPVDPNDTLSASFTISNNNFIPLRHVSAALGVEQIQPFGVPLDSHIPRYKNGGFVRTAWSNHSLDMDDKFTVTPSDLFKFKAPREASIAIDVFYQPWVLPWRREKIFRFDTHKNANGTFSWYSLPPN